MTRAARRPHQLASLRNGLFAALAVAVAYVGCSSDNANNTETSSGPNIPGGGFTPSDCEFGAPDGVCLFASGVETCDCADCATAAACTNDCNNDDFCDNDGGGAPEDCSCEDCYQKDVACAPDVEGCQMDEGEEGCQFNEACTCPDCTDTPFCTDNCVDDGECVPAYEGCACADCTAECGSGPSSSSSSTSSTGGAGGAGGSGGSVSAGGSGGAGAAGGAGGAGGA